MKAIVLKSFVCKEQKKRFFVDETYTASKERIEYLEKLGYVKSVVEAEKPKSKKKDEV